MFIVMQTRPPAYTPPVIFPHVLVNEAGSTTITSMSALRVSINLGAWQTLAAAGLTISVVSGDLVVAGFSGLETSIRFHFEQQQTGEPYSAQDTVGTANTTGTSISSIYVQHATGPKPALTLLPGIPIVDTLASTPVTAV